MLCSQDLFPPRAPVLRCLLRLLLCLCLVANTATGAWASVGMAMPQVAMPPTADAAALGMGHMASASSMPCHEDMAPPAPTQPDSTPSHAHAADCCKLGSCDCLQHCSLALLTLPAVPAGLPGPPSLPAIPAVGRGNPVPEQPVRPPIG
ncbi:CopL family metal-binding regulatory protein [Xanthomonas cucurbitae]|uniref:CopL family metal-binding regulatory protein n=1 Tax=Xanthomonas cucurbitae TaxID=56453 RepID=UPI0014761306|nr:CopL family metal-binding regulatory protein [Xanthomonas cucurbitae]WDM78698.1 CopL family metal-binding regulatory protein [Xanthomonas cucurbitae]WDM82378.1 CopL family metal-binding regulatory protein [Xanthomonas cucurbitae]